ncbi:MAG: [ribosomal protein S18]-alanine N-acetyltransferase [Solirubrobacteraceae bacterium]|nr:[ribosomal protein S18]-alanine N-acetyltransferase [Solirubrobacteraceae bacterium]
MVQDRGVEPGDGWYAPAPPRPARLMGDQHPPALTVSSLTETDAQQIIRWRYPRMPAYDLDEQHLPTLLDPANRYFRLSEGGELIGHFCIGPEARVPGLEPEAGIDDIGIGFHPDKIGTGRGRSRLAAALEAMRPELTGPRLRVAVAASNLRAVRAAESVGFTRDRVHPNQNGEYVILYRDLVRLGFPEARRDRRSRRRAARDRG